MKMGRRGFLKMIGATLAHCANPLRALRPDPMPSVVPEFKWAHKVVSYRVNLTVGLPPATTARIRIDQRAIRPEIDS